MPSLRTLQRMTLGIWIVITFFFFVHPIIDNMKMTHAPFFDCWNGQIFHAPVVAWKSSQFFHHMPSDSKVTSRIISIPFLRVLNSSDLPCTDQNSAASCMIHGTTETRGLSFTKQQLFQHMQRIIPKTTCDMTCEWD